jgi:predicted DNA-binding protein (MmcQ/YjbR family)
VTGRAVLAWCRRQPGAVEEYPFGPDVRVFKVGGKMFAVCPRSASPNQITLKCDPGKAIRLRREYPAVQPGYHANKRHWNTVRLDGSIPSPVVRQMLEDSYGLVFTSSSPGARPRARRQPKSSRRPPS